MLSTTRRVLATIFKEFWLPSALAIGFAFGGVSIEELRSAQGYFFGFLMLAWFTGQIFRIKREIERRDSVDATLERLSDLSEKLDKQFETISGHATGGKSFIRVSPHFDPNAGYLSIATCVEGEFPVRNVDLIVQDLEIEPSSSTAQLEHIEMIWPGEIRDQYHWPAQGKNQYRILIQFSALNHSTYCEVLILRQHDGSFTLANRQRVNNLPWVYQIPTDFPNYDKAKPELLFKFNMPEACWRQDF